ncbi:hypothetical protein Cantr_06833 [Candida viswanathii]|uniref:Rho termination factor N-terminal domain-containing protein n=1 Tax=Candida viswanathii TaxID=5486 RepID=A0A367XZL8_9ASCO|nr:hypothetical protein Cantr_06833 [Candida viswanathii]
MSELNKLNKADLTKLLRSFGGAGVSKFNKKQLIDQIESHIEAHPEDYDVVQKVLNGDDQGDDEDEEDDDIVEIEQEEVEVAVEPKEEEDEEDEEEEDEEEEEEEEEEEGEENDEDDKDYEAPPPLNLKEWVLDPIIAKSEDAIDIFYNFTDCVGITYLRESEKLRDQLSSTVTLNYGQLLLEFAVFIYNFTTIVPLNENQLIHQFFFDNLPYLSTTTLPTIEVSELLSHKALTTFVIWVLSSVVVPAAVSYFVNFTSRIVEIEDDEYLFRIHSFDPFIFALAKVLSYYAVGQAGLIGFRQADCLISGLVNKSLVNLGLYLAYASNSLGNLPYVLGGVNVLIAIYAQFEEY